MDRDQLSLVLTRLLGDEADDPGVARAAVEGDQRASEDGDRWRRYYEVIAPGWDRALRSLKRYLESG